MSAVAFGPPAPDGNDGWYKSPLLVTIAADDEEGGSGVEQTLWRLSGGVQRAYGGPFVLTTAGQYDFEFRAIDAAGNAEGFKEVPLKVDPEAPETTAAVTPSSRSAPAGGTTARDRPARGDDDQGSGVASTQYRVDGGAWTTYAGSVVVEQAGTHVVEYLSTDVAGNGPSRRR